ncbi:hypothetical protein [uncultured Rikenella sp.]|uniref:hypothetical protein n=1 Tax=uncultured Rikenella sp. TaxID=368003 RepID=UPI0027295972|nr:hypothetical protein [uncultured Rikenella sp.]
MGIANCGFVWSSVTSDIYGLDLLFSVTSLGLGYSDNCAHGFQLRCLSEETEPPPRAAAISVARTMRA